MFEKRKNDNKRKQFAQISLDNAIKFSQEYFGQKVLSLYEQILNNPTILVHEFNEKETKKFFKLKEIFKNK